MTARALRRARWRGVDDHDKRGDDHDATAAMMVAAPAFVMRAGNAGQARQVRGAGWPGATPRPGRWRAMARTRAARTERGAPRRCQGSSRGCRRSARRPASSTSLHTVACQLDVSFDFYLFSASMPTSFRDPLQSSAPHVSTTTTSCRPMAPSCARQTLPLLSERVILHLLSSYRRFVLSLARTSRGPRDAFA